MQRSRLAFRWRNQLLDQFQQLVGVSCATVHNGIQNQLQQLKAEPNCRGNASTNDDIPEDVNQPVLRNGEKHCWCPKCRQGRGSCLICLFLNILLCLENTEFIMKNSSTTICSFLLYILQM